MLRLAGGMHQSPQQPFARMTEPVSLLSSDLPPSPPESPRPNSSNPRSPTRDRANFYFDLLNLLSARTDANDSQGRRRVQHQTSGYRSKSSPVDRRVPTLPARLPAAPDMQALYDSPLACRTMPAAPSTMGSFPFAAHPPHPESLWPSIQPASPQSYAGFASQTPGMVISPYSAGYQGLAPPPCVAVQYEIKALAEDAQKLRTDFETAVIGLHAAKQAREELQSQCNEADATSKKLQVAVLDWQERHGIAESHTERLSKDLQSLRVTAQDKCQRMRDAWEQEHQVAMSEVRNLQGTLAQAYGDLDRAEEDASKARKDASAKSAELATAENRLRKLTTKNDELRSHSEAQRETHTGLETQALQLTAQVEEHRVEREAHRVECEALTLERASALTNHENAKSEHSLAQRKLKKVEKARRTSVDNRRAEFRQVELDRDNANRSCENMRQKHQHTQAKAERLHSELSSLEQSHGQAENESNSLREQLISSRSNKNEHQFEQDMWEKRHKGAEFEIERLQSSLAMARSELQFAETMREQAQEQQSRIEIENHQLHMEINAGGAKMREELAELKLKWKDEHVEALKTALHAEQARARKLTDDSSDGFDMDDELVRRMDEEVQEAFRKLDAERDAYRRLSTKREEAFQSGNDVEQVRRMDEEVQAALLKVNAEEITCSRLSVRREEASEAPAARRSMRQRKSSASKAVNDALSAELTEKLQALQRDEESAELTEKFQAPLASKVKQDHQQTLEEKKELLQAPATGSSSCHKGLPFLAVGRVKDAVLLASYCDRETYSDTEIKQHEDIFKKLLSAARQKLKPGQQRCLEWNDGNVSLFMDRQGHLLHGVASSSVKYPETIAYQLLQECLKEVQSLERIDDVPENGLNEALQKKMQELLSKYEELRDDASRESDADVKRMDEAVQKTFQEMHAQEDENRRLSTASDKDISPTVQIGKHAAMITSDQGIKLENVLNAKPFKDWIDSIAREERIKISGIHIQSVDMFGPRVGFMKFKADATVDGKFVPGIVFMRGGAVAILVILHHAGRRFTLLVRQPRVPVGLSNLAEIPAGMLDGDGNFAGVAAKEMKEETSLELKQSDLVDMTKLAYKDSYLGMFPTCGGSDEFNRIFLYQKTVTAEELENLNGKLTGVLAEGEMIKLQIVPFEKLWRMTPDAKALAALTLFQRLDSAGLIPKVKEAPVQLFL